jgi:RNA polymerase sigma-70 factor (ECF subfamily)
MWLGSAEDIGRWMLGPGAGCRNSRLVPVRANGSPAVAQYRPRAAGGHEPWALHVFEVEDGRIGHISSFLDINLFVLSGLPLWFDEDGRPMSSPAPEGLPRHR